MGEFGKLNFSVSFNRTSAFPIEANSYFNNYTEAEQAAQTAVEPGSADSTYYIGQTLTVADETDCNLYIIKPDQSLKRLTILDTSDVAWESILNKPTVFNTNIDNISDLHSSWDNILKSQKPTTLAGYGITDAYTKTESDSKYPTKTGSGASGTWGINITGNAGSSTKLQTARTIWGQSFDGTGNVSGNMSGVGNIITFENSISLLPSTSNPVIRLVSGGITNYVQALSNGSLLLGQAEYSSSYIAITKDGNVGISTSSPLYKLHVNGTTKSNAFLGKNIRIECENDGTPSNRENEINNFNSTLYLQYATSNNLVCCMGGGRVGIGTALPSQKLDVNGNININGYLLPLVNNKGIYIRNQATWHSGIGYDTTNNECMAFGVQNVNTKFKFKVGFDWSTFIGGGSYSNMPNADLEIGAGYVSMALGTSSQALRFESGNEINCYNGMLFLNYRGDGTGSLGSTSHIVMCANGGNVGIGITSPSQKLHVSGNILATGFYEESDIQLKTNIQPIDFTNNNIELVSFNWKKDGSKSYGVIAQQVEQYYPELVSTDESTGYKSVNYDAVLIIKCAQLENRIKQLEKQLEDLKYGQNCN